MITPDIQSSVTHRISHAEDEARAQAAATYNAAADSFDHPALSFWNLIGRRTIERLRLAPGASVLDVACGTGASAIPAAQWVGSSGKVLAIDLAERLLALGEEKARRLGVTNIEFRTADMERTGLADEIFDAIVCVFGIFFVPDMARALRELWRMVRPGGRLAITTWGPRMLEPGSSAFWAAIKRERPELVRRFSPWDRIDQPQSLEQLLRSTGVERVKVCSENNEHLLSCPDDWWTIALGSGFRGTIDQLDRSTRERVRAWNLAEMRGVGAVEVNALYAIGEKPLA